MTTEQRNKAEKLVASIISNAALAAVAFWCGFKCCQLNQQVKEIPGTVIWLRPPEDIPKVNTPSNEHLAEIHKNLL